MTINFMIITISHLFAFSSFYCVLKPNRSFCC